MSGDCPAPDDGLADFNAPLDPSCTVASSSWSHGDCEFTSDYTCVKSGATIHVIGVSQQMTQDGSQIDATETMRVQLADGAVCNGTLNISATRR